MKKPTYKLSEWSIVVKRTPYMAPEVGGIVKLSGKIEGHPTIASGAIIETTELIAIDVENMRSETVKDFFELGELDSDWADYLKENNYTLEQYSKVLKLTEDNKKDQAERWHQYKGGEFFKENFSEN